MAGLKGKSGPPGNMNTFKHGLAAIQKRLEESVAPTNAYGRLDRRRIQFNPGIAVYFPRIIESPYLPSFSVSQHSISAATFSQPGSLIM
jgi:hypothetical protein